MFKNSQSQHGIFNMSGGAVIKHNGTSITDVPEYTADAWKIWKSRFFLSGIMLIMLRRDFLPKYTQIYPNTASNYIISIILRCFMNN